MKKLLLTVGVAGLMISHLQAQLTTQTFNFTGAVQTFVVPPCVDSIAFICRGAEGGGNSSIGAGGGLGGYVQGTIPVVPGQTLYIYVGGMGSYVGTPGYNGGGLGANGSQANPGSGGGGASDIRLNGTTLNDRIVVAGGGGGGTENGGNAPGGPGGGLIGGSGINGPNPWGCTPLNAATGGTQSAGGFGGTSVSCAWNGTDGTFGIGGDAYPVYRTSGGGGGWYGGGGAHNGCGGGGGSSYTAPTVTSVIHQQGIHNGDGVIVLQYTPGATVGNVLGPASFCANANGTYSVTSMPGTYTWSATGGLTINSGQGTNSVNVSGTSSGSLSVIYVGVCNNDTAAMAITVNALPVVNLGPDTSICPGTYMLDAQNPGSTYLWSDNSTAQTLTTSVAGTYSVVVTNAAGCSASDAIVISQFTAPVVSLGPDLTVCDTACLDAGNPGSSYVWSIGDTTQISCVTTSGTYMVQINDPNGCDGYDTINVTVTGSPSVYFMMPMIFACADDDSIAISATPAGGVFSGPGVFGNMFSPSAAGPGYHILTYNFTDSLGCSGMDTSAIFVDLCLGVAQNTDHLFSIYPNPGLGVFNLTANTSSNEMMITVVDLSGRIVLIFAESNVATGSTRIVNLSNVESGTYLMYIESDGILSTEKIVIQH
jgi:hypothetical protein